MEWLKHANKAPWGIFFYAGVIFVVAAVTGGFAIKSDYTTVKETLVPFLFALGAVFLLYTMYREWLDSRPMPEPEPPVDPSVYKFEVIKKPPATTNSFPLIYEGKVRRDPRLDGMELWYLNGASPKFWPGNPVIVDPDKQWSARYTPGEFKSGDMRFFRFCLVGKNGQALIKAYRTINGAHVKPGGHYEPLTELTDDIITVFQHAVTLEKP